MTRLSLSGERRGGEGQKGKAVLEMQRLPFLRINGGQHWHQFPITSPTPRRPFCPQSSRKPWADNSPLVYQTRARATRIFFLKGETRGSRYWLGECLNFTNLPTHRQLPRHLLSPPLTHNTKTVVIWCGCQIITVYFLGPQSYKWKFFSIKKKIMLLKSQHLSWKFSKAFVKMRTSITSWTDQMFVSTVTCQSRVHCVSLAQRISYRPVTCDPLIEVNELTDMAHDWLGVAPPLAWGSYYSDQSIHQSDPLFYFFKSGKNWS